MEIHKQFIIKALQYAETEERILGMAVGGSWITNEMDEFSDLDLVLVTQEKISDDPEEMKEIAAKLGALLSAFTGEHVGEPRLLICLYDNPLLHVDLKFVTPDEFRNRVEDPEIVLDKTNELTKIVATTNAHYPQPNFQWIEDRFWTWVHYALLKIARGEYTEAFDFFGYLRMVIFGPLLQLKNHQPPRGVRKVEMLLAEEDLEALRNTLPTYSREGLLTSLSHSIHLYQSLRQQLFPDTIIRQIKAEEKVLEYLEKNY